MSPRARSLLALAAAALLHAAACDPQCTTVKEGDDGDFAHAVPGFHLDQTDSVTALPADQYPGYAIWPSYEVGVAVTACDPYGDAPQVELLGDHKRVRITCAWTNGQSCPQGIDVYIVERCEILSP